MNKKDVERVITKHIVHSLLKYKLGGSWYNTKTGMLRNIDPNNLVRDIMNEKFHHNHKIFKDIPPSYFMDHGILENSNEDYYESYYRITKKWIEDRKETLQSVAEL